MGLSPHRATGAGLGLSPQPCSLVSISDGAVVAMGTPTSRRQIPPFSCSPAEECPYPGSERTIRRHGNV